MPILCQIAAGKREALEYLVAKDRNLIANLGTGRGARVMELLRTFEAETGQRIPYRVVGRRGGDVAAMRFPYATSGSVLGA